MAWWFSRAVAFPLAFILGLAGVMLWSMMQAPTAEAATMVVASAPPKAMPEKGPSGQVTAPPVVPQPEPLVPVAFQGKIVHRIQTPQKWMALTFDDGPWGESTEQVLEILRKQKVPATFFLIGAHMERYPRLVQRIAKEGHVIGNHTWTHPYAPMDPVTAQAELDRTSSLLFQLTGQRSVLFRPPAGILNNGLVDAALLQRQTVVLWSDTTPDYQKEGTWKVVNTVSKGFAPGAIILLHDGGGDRTSTVRALPWIIRKARKAGYTLVTLPDLMRSAVASQQAVKKKPASP